MAQVHNDNREKKKKNAPRHSETISAKKRYTAIVACAKSARKSRENYDLHRKVETNPRLEPLKVYINFKRFTPSCSSCRTPHGASRLVQATSAWLVKTRRAPSRHSRDARVHGHTTTTIHKLSTPPPPPHGIYQVYNTLS